MQQAAERGNIAAPVHLAVMLLQQQQQCMVFYVV
jgi:hypothetical protein